MRIQLGRETCTDWQINALALDVKKARCPGSHGKNPRRNELLGCNPIEPGTDISQLFKLQLYKRNNRTQMDGFTKIGGNRGPPI